MIYKTKTMKKLEMSTKTTPSKQAKQAKQVKQAKQAKQAQQRRSFFSEKQENGRAMLHPDTMLVKKILKNKTAGQCYSRTQCFYTYMYPYVSTCMHVYARKLSRNNGKCYKSMRIGFRAFCIMVWDLFQTIIYVFVTFYRSR